jgi:hypothetical protein
MLNPIRNAANMQNMLQQQKTQSPTEHDANALMFKTLREPIKNRTKGWSGVANSFLGGLEAGSTASSIFQKKEDAEKYEKVMNYLTEVNKQAETQIQKHQQREQAIEQMKPLVTAFLSYSYGQPGFTPDVHQKDDFGRSLFNKAKLSGLVNGEYLGILPSNDTVMTYHDDRGKIQLFNMFSILPHEDQKLYYDMLPHKRAEIDAKRQIEQQKADASMMAAKAKLNKYAPQQTPELNEGELPLNSFSGEFRQGHEASVLKNFQKIPQNQQAIKTIQEMAKIFKEHPDIGQSFIHLLDTDNIWTVVSKPYADQKLLSAMQKLRKLASDLSLDVILSVPGKTATDVFKQTVKDAAPNGKLTKESFDSIAQNWITKANNNIQNATQGLQDLHRGVINANSMPHQEPSTGETKSPESSTGKLVKVRDPQTGEERELTSEQAQKVMQVGGIIIK